MQAETQKRALIRSRKREKRTERQVKEKINWEKQREGELVLRQWKTNEVRTADQDRRREEAAPEKEYDEEKCVEECQGVAAEHSSTRMWKSVNQGETEERAIVAENNEKRGKKCPSDEIRQAKKHFMQWHRRRTRRNQLWLTLIQLFKSSAGLGHEPFPNASFSICLNRLPICPLIHSSYWLSLLV